MSKPIRGQNGHLIFQFGLKNTNLVEDVEILIPVKFRWISFSGFRGEVENVSANQRPGPPSVFQIPPKNTNLVGDIEVLWSYLEFRSAVSGEVVIYQPIRGFGGHFVFPIGKRNAEFVSGRPSCFSDQPPPKLSRGCWDVAFCKVFLIPFSGFRGEFENISFCQVSLSSLQRFQRRSRKCVSQSEALAAILFPIGPKNTNFVENIDILLPVKFVEVCPAVSEEKSKMWLVNDGRTMDNAWSELFTWAFGSGAQNSLTTKKVWLPDRQTEAGQSNPYRPLCFVGDTKMTQDDLDLWAMILPLTMNNLHLKFESNQTNIVVFMVPIRVVAVELWFYVTFNIYFSYIVIEYSCPDSKLWQASTHQCHG